jgi:hypothetical protein
MSKVNVKRHKSQSTFRLVLTQNAINFPHYWRDLLRLLIQALGGKWCLQDPDLGRLVFLPLHAAPGSTQTPETKVGF